MKPPRRKRLLATALVGVMLVACSSQFSLRPSPTPEDGSATQMVSATLGVQSITQEQSTLPAVSSPTGVAHSSETPAATENATSTPQTGDTTNTPPSQASTADLTSTAIVEAIQATVTPVLYQSFTSSDGQFKAVINIYGCTQIAPDMGAPSYEILKVMSLNGQQNWIVDSQLLVCQGLGGGGLGGLFWSNNSRYFYYTTARDGSPDGGSIGWMRPASRFDITTGHTLSLRGMDTSPDQSKIAAADGQDLVVWDLNGTEVARFKGADVVPAGSANAWVHYFAWSADSRSVAYIISIPSANQSTNNSLVLVANLDQKKTSVVLSSSSPEYIEVHWKDSNNLALFGWPFASWNYNLVDQSLTPGAIGTSTPRP